MVAKKKPAKQHMYSMDNIHSIFIENVESLASFVANLSPVAKKHDLAVAEQTKGSISRMLERLDKELGLTTTVSKEEFGQRLKNLNKSQQEQMLKIATESTRGLRRLSPRQGQLLYQASFVLLMSYLDFLIFDLVHYFYHKYPGSLSEKGYTLTLGELKDFNEIANVIDFLIDKEVQGILPGSFNKQVQYFKSPLKLEQTTRGNGKKASDSSQQLYSR